MSLYGIQNIKSGAKRSRNMHVTSRNGFYVAVDSPELFLRRINQTCSARYAKASPFVAATAAMDVHAGKPDASSNHATAKPRTESEQATEW